MAAWSYPLCGPKASTSRLSVEEWWIYLPSPPTRLNPHIQWWAGLSFCVTPSVITIPDWYRNVDLFSIGYAFRPRLRDRLTLSGLTFLRKP